MYRNSLVWHTCFIPEGGKSVPLLLPFFSFPLSLSLSLPLTPLHTNRAMSSGKRAWGDGSQWDGENDGDGDGGGAGGDGGTEEHRPVVKRGRNLAGMTITMYDGPSTDREEVFYDYITTFVRSNHTKFYQLQALMQERLDTPACEIPINVQIHNCAVPKQQAECAAGIWRSLAFCDPPVTEAEVAPIISAVVSHTLSQMVVLKPGLDHFALSEETPFLFAYGLPPGLEVLTTELYWFHETGVHGVYNRVHTLRWTRPATGEVVLFTTTPVAKLFVNYLTLTPGFEVQSSDTNITRDLETLVK